MKTLIIDRVTVLQQMIASALADSDIEHMFAASGQQALESLKKEPFDCICLSLYLDDMDGYELTQKIRKLENYKFTPIVLLTSKNDDEVTHKAIDSGITDVFLKDNIHELVNFISRFTQVDSPITGKVLYIEDQKSQREYIEAILKERELEIDAFDNAEDALQAFLKNHYQLVITDIVLAGKVSGVLLINKIRRLEGSRGETPILAITAFDDTSRRISLYHMGITDYVAKPIIKEELIARVRNLINNQKALEREIDFHNYLNSEENTRRTIKLEALGKLTGGIAHDYNNLLSIISGYADIVLDRAKDQPAITDYMEQTKKTVDRGIKLTSKLLSFTKTEDEAAEIININNLVDDIFPLLEKTLTKNIKLQTRLENNLWLVNIDSNDLENAVINMCINAKHAMEDEGKLTLLTANCKLGAESAESIGLAAGEYVRLSIKDTGSGIDSDTLSKIFDPFFTTKGNEGTGLGLSQVYGFMQRAKGTVRVESKPGKGTVFNLYFPRENAQVHNNTAGTDNDIDTINTEEKNCNVLVVDDEVSLAQLTRTILISAGYQVDVAYTASEALEKLKQQNFDLIISDVVMPGMNGFEMAEHAKKAYPDIKIIMVTGYDKQLTPTDKAKQYYDQKLAKPVSRKQLLSEIEAVLNSAS